MKKVKLSGLILTWIAGSNTMNKIKFNIRLFRVCLLLLLFHSFCFCQRWIDRSKIENTFYYFKGADKYEPILKSTIVQISQVIILSTALGESEFNAYKNFL